MLSPETYFSIISSTLLGVALLSALIISFRTKSRGLFLLDSYFAGIAIYTLGALILALGNPQKDELFLLQISLVNFFVTFLLWSVNRAWSHNGVRLTDFYLLKTKNKVFANSSVIILVLINITFVYLIYIRIVQGHFAGTFLLLDIRKTIASGEAGYFAPGLIKQIRDIFAPACIVWLVLFYQGKTKWYLIWLLFLVVLVSMIMGGQRMPVLVLFISMGLSYYFKLRMENREISLVKLIVFTSLSLLIVFFLNILLGRAGGEANGFFSSFINLMLSIITRVFTTVPEENVHLLSYINKIQLEPFALWVSDLAIILPGTQEAFSNQLHSYLGGSKQGNAVLGAPLDIYVNSGFLGLLIVPVMVSVVLYFTQTLLMKKPNPLAVSIFLVFFNYMPFCYSFYLFLLNGGLLVIFYSLYNVLVVRKRRPLPFEIENSFPIR